MQETLNRLKGKSENDVKKALSNLKPSWKVRIVNLDKRIIAMTAIARPDTFVVWIKDNKVSSIGLGDPTQVEK